MKIKISTIFAVPPLLYFIALFHTTQCGPYFIPLLQIPSTNLSTGVFYTITMKTRPLGVITWTDKHTLGGGNYLQVDLTPGRRTKQYKPGGVWHHTTQFLFQPLKHISTQFLLRNRYDLSRMVTSQFEEESGYMFVTWDSKESGAGGGGDLETKSFMTPVGTQDPSEFKVQLQFSRFSRRFVTAAPLKYGNYSYHMQVAPAGSEYDLGGGSWNSTLFKFSPVTEGVVLTFGVASSKEYWSSLGEGGLEGGEIVTVYQETFRNPGPFPTINVIKTLLPDTSGGFLTINNPALAPYIQLADNFTIDLLYKGGLGPNKNQRVFYAVTSKPDVNMNKNSLKNYIIKPIARLLPLPPKVIKGIAPNETLEFSVKQEVHRNLEIPFTLTIPVSGEGDRVLGDNGGGVARGPMPPDVIQAALVKLGVDVAKDVEIRGDQLFLSVGGVIKGTFLFGVETAPAIV